MISSLTLDEVVTAIYNETEHGENAKILANEASLYFNTAIICEARGIKRAMDYFKTEKGTKLYEAHLLSDPMQN